MNKNFKRIIALALVVLTALSVFAACGKENKPSDGTGSGTGTDTATPGALPDMNLGGYDFVVYARSGLVGNGAFKAVDVDAEDQNLDLINDAVYLRNQAIESKYNCNISQQYATSKEMLANARNAILSGDGQFDAFVGMGSDAATLAQEGLLSDLNTLKYLQLNGSWWDQNSVRDLSIGGKLFMVTGDISISCSDALQVPVFNKQVLAKYTNLENPYTLVREGKWTLGKMTEMAMQANADIDGTPGMSSSDQWGYVAYPWGSLFLFYGSGERITTKSSEDIPELSIYNDRSVKVMEDIFAIHGDPANGTTVLQGWSKTQTKLMSEDRFLFTITSLFTCRNQFRVECQDNDFGVLPNPKYEESQENYMNLVTFQDTCNVWSVVRDPYDKDKVGFIMEAMAQGSADTLQSAYMDKIILFKTLRDDDSRDMLKTYIIPYRCFDLAQVYNWGNWNTYFKDNFGTLPSNTFTSEYDSNAEATRQAILETVNDYKNIAD